MGKIPSFLKGYFKNNAGSFKEYVIFRLQLATLFLFLLALAVSFRPSPVLYVVVGLLFSANAYSIATEIRSFKDAKAYIYFFAGLNILSLILAISKLFTQTFNLEFTIAYVAVFLAFLALFQVLFRRNFTIAKVLIANSDWASVQASYDIRAGISNGFYTVKSKKGVRKGDTVTVQVTSGLGQQRKPWKILDKV